MSERNTGAPTHTKTLDLSGDPESPSPSVILKEVKGAAISFGQGAMHIIRNIGNISHELSEHTTK